MNRKSSMDELINILLRKEKSNPLLIGEPGVGKTTMVENLAQLINRKEVPLLLQNKKIFEVNLTALLAGTNFRGDFEKRFEIKGATQDEKNASIWRFDLALKDRKAGAFVRQIQLTTNVDDGTLLSLLLVMRDKSSLGTYIKSQRLNNSIPASTFQVDTDGYVIEEMK